LWRPPAQLVTYAKEVMFLSSSVCVTVCDNSERFQRILIKCFEEWYIRFTSNKTVDFGAYSDHDRIQEFQRNLYRCEIRAWYGIVEFNVPLDAV